MGGNTARCVTNIKALMTAQIDPDAAECTFADQQRQEASFVFSTGRESA